MLYHFSTHATRKKKRGSVQNPFAGVNKDLRLAKRIIKKTNIGDQKIALFGEKIQKEIDQHKNDTKGAKREDFRLDAIANAP